MNMQAVNLLLLMGFDPHGEPPSSVRITQDEITRITEDGIVRVTEGA